MKTAFHLLASAGLFAALAAGQVVPNQYVVELKGDSALAALARKSAVRPARDPRLADVRARVRASQASAQSAVAAFGGRVLGSFDLLENALIISLPGAKAEQLTRIPGVARVRPVHRRRRLLDTPSL